jgi:hypothetical protein
MLWTDISFDIQYILQFQFFEHLLKKTKESPGVRSKKKKIGGVGYLLLLLSFDFFSLNPSQTKLQKKEQQQRNLTNTTQEVPQWIPEWIPWPYLNEVNL